MFEEYSFNTKVLNKIFFEDIINNNFIFLIFIRLL